MFVCSSLYRLNFERSCKCQCGFIIFAARPSPSSYSFFRINLLSQSGADHNVTRLHRCCDGGEVSHIDNCHIITQKRDAHFADVNYDHFWCHCQTVHGRLDKIIVTATASSVT